jgi:hypothetical protein
MISSKNAAIAANSSMVRVSARLSPEIPAFFKVSPAISLAERKALPGSPDSIITEEAKAVKVFLIVFLREEKRLRTRR